MSKIISIEFIIEDEEVQDFLNYAKGEIENEWGYREEIDFHVEMEDCYETTYNTKTM